MSDDPESTGIFSAALTLNGAMKLSGIIIGAIIFTWQASNFTHGILDRLSNLEQKVSEIDHKLDRWHSDEHAAFIPMSPIPGRE